MGKNFGGAAARLRHKSAAAVLFVPLFALSACAIQSGGQEPRRGLDNTATYSVNCSADACGAAGQIAPRIRADSAVIAARLNAANSTKADEKGAKTQRWENAATGSSGVISAFAEQGDKQARLCRLFETTRDSYDGSALYRGKACKYGANPWQLQYLTEN